MLNNTTITNWFFVTFYDVTPSQQILWGIIAEDPSCRWYPGDYVCTSMVLEQVSEKAYVTKNTRYTVLGSGKHVKLPIRTLPHLRDGISPEQIANKSFLSEEEMGRTGLA